MPLRLNWKEDGSRLSSSLTRQGKSPTLRAAADQVVPENAEAVGDKHDDARADQWMRIRYKLLAIAAELDGTIPTNQEDYD